MAKDDRVLEVEFRELVNKAVQDRWDRDGRYSAKDILKDIRSHEKTWIAIAERLATLAIRKQIAARELGVDPAQEKFAFVKELPVSSITYKGTVVSILRASAEEFMWHTKWYRRRLAGIVKKSKAEKKTLARLERVDRLVGKYREDDPNISIREVIEARHERLAALRKKRTRASVSG